MRWEALAVWLLAATAFAAPATYRVGHEGFDLPDPTVTPGKVATTDLKTVCTTVWGKDVRHVPETVKHLVCQTYGARDCPGPKWEIDHLVSRELGGQDDEKNLWPQRIHQARVKDRVENRLHREVCAGNLPLRTAQWGLATDWTQYLKFE